MNAVVKALTYHLPENVLTTENLAVKHPDWDVPKIDQQTGIHARPVAASDQCASDLAVESVRKLFAEYNCEPQTFDFILFCTQTPDHFLPPTACLLQERLGLPTSAGALDFNLGSSGYVYGLGLAQGLISSGQVSHVLLLTADTYSKLLHPKDRSVCTIFGDAATATWIAAEAGSIPSLGPFVYGTDGSGGGNLIVPAGAMRLRSSAETAVEIEDSKGNIRSQNHLFMDGIEIFSFTMRAVPPLVQQALSKAQLSMDDIDMVVFHQANQSMLEHLRKVIRIPKEKFMISLAHCGNTVSSSIPIALKDALEQGRIQDGSKVLLVGFGVGYSWGATVVRWRG
jgi:3-oxoacyl-[acyl-carrier-protein] synthase III